MIAMRRGLSYGCADESTANVRAGSVSITVQADLNVLTVCAKAKLLHR
jgi:hypothetical protein